MSGTEYTRKAPQNDKVVIDGSQFDGDPVKEWTCHFCNYIIHARKSRGEAVCSHCKAEC
jgi:hypothetical protein